MKLFIDIASLDKIARASEWRVLDSATSVSGSPPPIEAAKCDVDLATAPQKMLEKMVDQPLTEPCRIPFLKEYRMVFSEESTTR